MARPETLVVVHPGSACGSADFNLGEAAADAARARLSRAIEEWDGPLAVVDGELSDELLAYTDLDRTIRDALTRAGRRGARVKACDAAGETHLAAGRVVDALQLDPARDAMVVTGCWFDPKDGWGCVNEVARGFREMGFEARVDETSAVAQDEPGEPPVAP